MTLSKQSIGYIVEIGGLGALGVGVALSIHHAAIAACIVAGAGALYVGKKIRALA